MPCQVLLAEQLGNACYPHPFVARNLQQGRVATSDLSHNTVAQKSNHLPREMSGTVAFANQPVHQPQNLFARTPGYRLHHFLEHRGRRGANQLPYRIGSEAPIARGDGLIQNRERVAYRTIPGLGQQCERILVGFDILTTSELFQLSENRLKAHRPKTEMLAARADSLRNILRLSCSEHENHMARRFLQRFQQSIEGRVRNLVSFIEDVNLEPVACRAISSR